MTAIIATPAIGTPLRRRSDGAKYRVQRDCQSAPPCVSVRSIDGRGDNDHYRLGTGAYSLDPAPGDTIRWDGTELIALVPVSWETTDHRLYCLNLDTGRTAWVSLDPGDEPVTWVSAGMTPTVEGQRVVATLQGRQPNIDRGTFVHVAGGSAVRYRRDNGELNTVYLGQLRVEDEAPPVPDDTPIRVVRDHLRAVLGGWEAYHADTWRHLASRAGARGYVSDYGTAIGLLPAADDVITDGRTYVFPSIPSTDDLLESVTVTVSFEFTVELDDDDVISAANAESLDDIETDSVRVTMRASATRDVDVLGGGCGCDEVDRSDVMDAALDDVRGVYRRDGYPTVRCSSDDCSNN